jgi:hypothetical protein
VNGYLDDFVAAHLPADIDFERTPAGLPRRAARRVRRLL